jgi:hypothetical protein
MTSSSEKGTPTRYLQTRAILRTITRRSSLFSFWMVSICGCFFVWNNLTRGGRLILSTFVFPDNPVGVESWNGCTTNVTTTILRAGEDRGGVDRPRADTDTRNRNHTVLGVAGLRSSNDNNATVFSGGTNTNTVTIDPYSLKKGIESFLKDDRRRPPFSNGDGGGDGDLWDLLEHYPPPVVALSSSHSQQTTPPAQGERENGGKDNDRPFYYNEHDRLSAELVCGAGPGRGMEQDGGYKILVEKIRILAPDATPTTKITTTKTTTTTTEASIDETIPRTATAAREQSRLLCLVYTYSPMRHLLKTQALVWGQHCDGFLAFSNETLPELGIYELPIDQRQQQDYREESYNNMWQKSRGIWKHVHDNLLERFEYFYLSGDDVYLMVNNLRAYLREELETIDASDPKPRHFGSWLPSRSMVAGGPGYVLNRAALQLYAGTAETNIHTNASTNTITNTAAVAAAGSSSVWSTCLAHTHRPYEDRYLSECLSRELGIFGNDTDTRDPSTGEQRFHDTDPATLYLFRAAQHAQQKSSSYLSRMAKTWEDQPMPMFMSSGGDNTVTADTASATATTTATATATATTSRQMLVGPKHGLDAAAKHSISLHRIFTPTYMARIHVILHPATCPIDSPLGKGLKKHSLFVPETT